MTDPGASPPLRPLRALLLLLLTWFSTTTLGGVFTLAFRTDIWTDLMPWGLPLLSPHTIAVVWSSPALLERGLAFSLPALTILLAHELGHYLACRHYGIAATLPAFLPVPFGFGTLGAFIRIRSPIRNKRELFDVGVAGPIAGFVVLIPVLLYGLAHSAIGIAEPATDPALANSTLWLPGQNLALHLATELFHGTLAANEVLNPHPFVIAAWFGMFATALNLLPLSQLDGGHLLYAVLGRRQRQIALPLWLALGSLALLWPGWGLWCLITYFLGLRHPPVLDEEEPLDRKRQLLAAVALVILVLCFAPEPLAERPVALSPGMDGAPAPTSLAHR